MYNKELLITTTPQEQELIRMVLDRARKKQKEREGDSIKLPSYSHQEGLL